MKKIKVLLFIIIIILVSFIPVSILKSGSDTTVDLVINDSDIYSASEEIVSVNYADIINTYREEYNNDEVVAVLNILNTDYSRPVMQHSDNSYYLNHLENKESHYLGSLFADYRIDIDASKKILIYGHNSKYIEMPFKILENYYDSNYFNEHQYIELITSTQRKLYQIFSIYVETSDYSYMQLDYENTDSWYNHLLSLKSKSLYDTSVNVNKDDEILILQTCSTHNDYKNYDHKFLLIILRRITNEKEIY